MNKDHSFEKIDITKLLLWICILLIFVFVVWATLIIPSSNKLKISNNEYKVFKSELLNETTKLQVLEGRIKELEAKNAQELSALSNHFDRDKFISFAKVFFDEASLDDDLLPDSEKYEGYKLQVSTKLNSPSNFYDFIDSLNSYSNILKIDFPILMKRQDDMIKAQFNLKVYKNSQEE